MPRQLGLSRKILLDNDYVEWTPNNFQKKFCNINGVKYFIHINKLEFGNMVFWNPSIQIETKNGTVDIKPNQWFNEVDGVYSGERTLEDLETFFEMTWSILSAKYYEEY